MSLSLDFDTLKRGYQSGTLDPADVVREIYRRIEDIGESPIWISLLPRDQAIARARSAPKGPLWGIPFAVKDNIDAAGFETTCACPAFAYRPEASATVVEKLEAAGAILIGKTNLDQFATGLNGTRSPYGIPASAFNPDYISGGSSSGSAVAVAKGLVSFALGTDTAGSGRVPAGFNNIVGLKPTKGLISTRGVVPACRSQDCVSIFALTVADAAAVLSLAEGPDPVDAYSRARPAGLPAAAPPQDWTGVRVGIPSAPPEFFGDAGAEALYRQAIARAQSLGASLVEIDFSPFAEAASLLYTGPWVAERLAAIETFAKDQPDAIIEPVRQIILSAASQTAVEAFRGLYRLAELTKRAETEWQAMDLLMLPTSGTIYTIAAMLADPVRLNSNLGLTTNFVNLMDLSAIAIPAGLRTSGLPFGVTLIGRAFTEPRLAPLADALHRAQPDATLGATAHHLSITPACTPPAAAPQTVPIAVVGAHLSGEPLNGQLTERGATLVRTARTAPGYSFYALANTTPPKPGLVFDGTGQGLIEVEIWDMPVRPTPFPAPRTSPKAEAGGPGAAPHEALSKPSSAGRAPIQPDARA